MVDNLTNDGRASDRTGRAMAFKDIHSPNLELVNAYSKKDFSDVIKNIHFKVGTFVWIV